MVIRCVRRPCITCGPVFFLFCNVYNCHGNLVFLSWNIIEKSLKFFKSCLWEPWVENMVTQFLWWLAIILISKIFVYPDFQLPNIQYLSKSHSIRVLSEEGLIVAWWGSLSAVPTFQSSVAVYNHPRWSRITTGFFWIVWFNNGQ